MGSHSRTRLKRLSSSSSRSHKSGKNGLHLNEGKGNRWNFCFLRPVHTNFHDSSVGKESVCNAGDPGLIPGSRRSAGEGIGYPLQYSWASLVAQLVKNSPAMQETWVGRIPQRRERLPTPVFWPREFHGLYPWGRKESDTTERLSLPLFTYTPSLVSAA